MTPKSKTWVERWHDVIAAKPSLPGVWRRYAGGFHVRARVINPTTKKHYTIKAILSNMVSARDAAAWLDAERAFIQGKSNANADKRAEIFLDPKPWPFKQALKFVRNLERIAIAHGAHVALTGGVLKHGRSSHDLDILVYPHNAADGFDYQAFVQTLALHDIVIFRDCVGMWAHWRYKGVTDTKHVEVFSWKGRRIDIIRMRA